MGSSQYLFCRAKCLRYCHMLAKPGGKWGHDEIETLHKMGEITNMLWWSYRSEIRSHITVTIPPPSQQHAYQFNHSGSAYCTLPPGLPSRATARQDQITSSHNFPDTYDHDIFAETNGTCMTMYVTQWLYWQWNYHDNDTIVVARSIAVLKL